MSTINLIPKYLREIQEYKAISDAFDLQFDQINDRLEYILKQSAIMTADEKRISEWEAFLKIKASGNLYQRKQFIIATLTSIGKLNERKIQEIVNIYTEGGGAIVQVTTNSIIVKVKPPVGGEIFLLDDIYKTLDKMKPAHLTLILIRFYSTYKNINDDFISYLEINNYFSDYGKLRNYIKEW